jgi:AP-1 complex subunit beta-1
MGCLRAEKIIDYLSDPLHKALKDQDPYVRKTAALCVAKLYELKPELAIDNGFLEQLLDMVSDSNPMVSSLATLAIFSNLFSVGCLQCSSSASRYSYHDCREPQPRLSRTV